MFMHSAFFLALNQKKGRKLNSNLNIKFQADHTTVNVYFAPKMTVEPTLLYFPKCLSSTVYLF